MILYKYKIYCETSGQWEYIWLESAQAAPTTCPVNTGHTVTNGSAAIEETLNNAIQPVDVQFVPSTLATEATLGVVVGHVDGVKTRLDTINTSVGSNGTKLDTVNTNITSTNTKLDTVNTNITSSNTKLDTVNTKLDTVNASVGSNGTKLDTVNTNITSTNTKLDSLIAVNKASGAAISSILASTSSVPLIGSNASRKGLVLFNDSNSSAHVAFGATATTTAFTVKMAPQSLYIMDFPIYTGAINSIWSTANGSMRITELT